MDNYEYNNPEMQPEETPVQETPIYTPPYTPRKASPFADSPYEFQPPVYAPPKKVKKSRSGGKTFLSVLLVILLVAGSCFGTAAVLNSRWESKMDSMNKNFQSKLDALEDALDAAAGSMMIPGTTVSSTEGLTPAQVYAMNVRSVVMIYNRVSGSAFGQTSVATSTGSGFFLSKDGYVVTNHHVIEGGGNLSIMTFDGTEYPATLVGSDQANDVALLKVDGQDFPAVTLGSSDALVVGDQVVAIGNPLGELTSTQTVGYVSAKERGVNTSGFAINMIQTDAAINSGNSGGPLFNMNGEVVGITTAKYSGSSGSGATIEGIGFAIPIDDVKDMLEDFTNYGYVQSAYLGISVSDMDLAAVETYNMPMGAYVVDVVRGNCAHTAGIQAKDIIVAIGEYEVTGVNSLSKVLRRFQAGDQTTVTVFRGGKEIVMDITLDEKPRDLTTTETTPATPETPDVQLPDSNDFQDWFDFFRDYYGNNGG